LSTDQPPGSLQVPDQLPFVAASMAATTLFGAHVSPGTASAGATGLLGSVMSVSGTSGPLDASTRSVGPAADAPAGRARQAKIATSQTTLSRALRANDSCTRQPYVDAALFATNRLRNRG
jgi:hypothetical protein